MLSYSRKCVNTIATVITLIICIVLFVILDFCFLNLSSNYNYRKELGELKKENRIDKDAVKVENTFLEFMQIADIYENGDVIEVDNITQTTENAHESNIENSVEKILDKNNKWRIKIPKIGIDVPIKSGTTQEVLATAVGHFENSSKWNGNVPLAGHNRGYNCNFFRDLKELEIGDKIIYSTEKGKRTYIVTLNKIIKQTDWSLIENTADNRITLITCVENMHEYRRCVQAVEIF